jgi:hypothetical protein
MLLPLKPVLQPPVSPICTSTPIKFPQIDPKLDKPISALQNKQPASWKCCNLEFAGNFQVTIKLGIKSGAKILTNISLLAEQEQKCSKS